MKNDFSEDLSEDFSFEEKSPKHRSVSRKKRSGNRPVPVVIIADLLLAGFILLLFAYIHHGRAKIFNESTVGNGTQISTGTTTEKPADITFTLNAPAANVGDTVTASVEVTTSAKVSNVVLVLEYDGSMLESTGTYQTDTGIIDGTSYEFAENETEEGAQQIILTVVGTSAAFASKGTVYTADFKVKAPLNGVTPATLSIADDKISNADGTVPTFKIVNNNGDKTQQATDGDFSVVFADKFTTGEIEQTENSYKSSNVNVTWSRHEDKSTGSFVVYYVADIYVRSTDYLLTAKADGNSDRVEDMAEANNAIIAINGDYFGARKQGPAVRNGVLYRDSAYKDVLVMYKNGVFKAFGASEFDMDTEIDNAEKDGTSIVNVWSFGPSLLDSEGHAKEEFDSDVYPANPRSVIGYYEPGHYCFIAVNGRGEENSVGFRLETLSKVCEELGCTIAYNLDGGKSSVMAWDCGSKQINSADDGGRSVSDIIYVPKK